MTAGLEHHRSCGLSTRRVLCVWDGHHVLCSASAKGSCSLLSCAAHRQARGAQALILLASCSPSVSCQSVWDGVLLIVQARRTVWVVLRFKLQSFTCAPCSPGMLFGTVFVTDVFPQEWDVHPRSHWPNLIGMLQMPMRDKALAEKPLKACFPGPVLWGPQNTWAHTRAACFFVAAVCHEPVLLAVNA